MEQSTNLTPAPSSAGAADELNKLPPDSPYGGQRDDGVDLGQERGSEPNEAIDTENGSSSLDKNQSSDTENAVRGKDSHPEPESLNEDVETVIKNQHKYYIYCPCCGEDITKTVKLVKKSDLQPTENKAVEAENSSRFKDKKTKVPSWFPIRLQQLFLSVYGNNADKGKKGVDPKAPGSCNNLDINDERPSIHVRIEKDRPGWFLDVFAWMFLCIIIALSVLSTSPPPFIQPHLQLTSMPSASVLLLLPTFAVLLVIIIAMRIQGIESKPSTSRKNQYHNDQATDPEQGSEMKKDNQKVAEIGTEAEAQAEPRLKAEIPNSVKGSKKVEILKSIVYGGLTESITSLCTVTSAAASGASTMNVLALGVANLSSGLLLIFHSLQELIKEKPRGRSNTEDEKSWEEDRYEQVLGRRERMRLHSLLAITSFLIFGLIPPLVYGFSYRRKLEKRKEYKVLAVYAVSLLCVACLSIAKAYVSKRREYLKTLFRYTTMAATASGFSQFVGCMVSQWLEKTGFYDDFPPL